MLDRRPTDTPIGQNQVPTDKDKYTKLVLRLIYLSYTMPHIAYVVSVLSEFMHNPSESHVDVVLSIWRYLKSALGKCLVFSNNGCLDVSAYTNAIGQGVLHTRDPP